MDILILLIPMSLVLVALIGAAFAWSVKSGQYDDLEGPAHRILADDDGAPAQEAGAPLDPAALTPVNPRDGAARTMSADPERRSGASCALPRDSTMTR